MAIEGVEQQRKRKKMPSGRTIKEELSLCEKKKIFGRYIKDDREVCILVED